MTKRTFPNPLLAALTLAALLTATAFAAEGELGTVTANYNGGTSTSASTPPTLETEKNSDGKFILTAGEVDNLPKDLEKDGFKHIGWSLDGQEPVISDLATNPFDSDDETIKAVWKEDDDGGGNPSTTVTITLNRGTAPSGWTFTPSSIADLTIPKGSKLQTVPGAPSPQPTCYQFSHWKTGANNTEVTTAYLNSTAFNEGATFIAEWTRTCFTVKLDQKGNGPEWPFTTPDSVNTNAAGKLTSIPAAPSTEPTCRRFSHWTSGSSPAVEVTQAYLNNTFTVTSSSESTAKFTAVWTSICSAVTIDPGLGELIEDAEPTIATLGTGGNTLSDANIAAIKSRLKAPECFDPASIELFKVASPNNVKVVPNSTTFADEDEVTATWTRTCYVATIDKKEGNLNKVNNGLSNDTVHASATGGLTAEQITLIKGYLSMPANNCFDTDKATLTFKTSSGTVITEGASGTQLNNDNKAQNKIVAVWERTCYIVKIEKNAGTSSKSTALADVNGKFTDAQIAEIRASFTAAPVCSYAPDDVTNPMKLSKTNDDYAKVTNINSSTVFDDPTPDANKVYAVFKDVPSCRKITFNSDGGSLATVAYEIDATTGKIKTGSAWPSNPTKAQNSFAGWKARDFNNDFFTVTSDTDLGNGTGKTFAGVSNIIAVAQWIPNSTPARPAAPAIASTFSIVVSSQSLQIVGASKAMPVSIYNLKGKLVLNSTAMPNESISLAHLPKGVYIVRAGSKTAKFAR